MYKPTLIATAALAAAALAPAAASATGRRRLPGPEAETGLPKPADAQFQRPGRQGRAPRQHRHRVRHEGARLQRAPGAVAQRDALADGRQERSRRARCASRSSTAPARRASTTRRSTADDLAHQVQDAGLHVVRLRGRALPRLRPAGIMKVTGEQTVDGRRLLALESVAGKWKSSDPGSRADRARRRRDATRCKQIESILDGGLFNQTVEQPRDGDPRRRQGDIRQTCDAQPRRRRR